MAICPHTCPTGSSTLLSRQSIPQRFRSNNTGYRQQLHSRPTAQSLDSFGRKRASISHRQLTAQAQRPCISCAAATAEAPESTVKLESVPRGETDGANLVLENVTIQAGHRDLLQVRLDASTTSVLGRCCAWLASQLLICIHTSLTFADAISISVS